MLNAAQPLAKSTLSSALAGQSRLRPKSGSRFRRTMVASLMLTSLVDAFSILVIFLIMNHSTSQEVVNLGQKITLPTASESGLVQQGVVVRIEGQGQFNVDEVSVSKEQLVAHLKALAQKTTDEAKKESLVIVADRGMDYEALSPVILAGSQAGFTKFKFAVIRK